MKQNIWLHRFAVIVACSTFVLIIAGGLVTSTGSGLAVPDWPLSYGQIMPPMVGGIFFEHGHRMVAAFVGLVTTILAIWICRAEERRWVRWLGLAALMFVITQGVLGGLTVLFLLPTPISVAHATLAQTFFCILISLALFTSPEWRRNQPKIEDEGKPSLPTLALATTAVIYLQLILGALMRHTDSGLAVPDFPLAYGYLIPPLNSTALKGFNKQLVDMGLRLAADPVITANQILIHLVHRLGAVLTTGFVLWTAVKTFKRYKGELKLLLPALLMPLLVLFQILLGIFTLFTQKNIGVATAHVAVGALILATSVVFTLWSYKILAVQKKRVELSHLSQEAKA